MGIVTLPESTQDTQRHFGWHTITLGLPEHLHNRKMILSKWKHIHRLPRVQSTFHIWYKLCTQSATEHNFLMWKIKQNEGNEVYVFYT